MNSPDPAFDYSRVSDDAAILCCRQDFPRAVRLLTARSPDHRRWRRAFRGVAAVAVDKLDGARRRWMSRAVRDLVENVVAHPWLRSELAIDLHSVPDFAIPGVLPEWTARELWRFADAESLPMAYIAQVTQLPRAIDALVDTAQLVIDFRRTAVAHREAAAQLHATMQSGPVHDALPLDDMLLRVQLDAQRDAAERWRGLARRLLLVAPRDRDTLLPSAQGSCTLRA